MKTGAIRIISLAICLPFVGFQSAAVATEALYHRKVHEKTAGEPIVMTIDELRRDQTTSTLKTKYVSGAPLPASMISMQAVYDIGRARNIRYCIILKTWTAADGDEISLVGFTRDKNINPQKYSSLKKPLPKDDEHELIDLKDFDLMFKGRQWSLKDLDAPFKNSK